MTSNLGNEVIKQYSIGFSSGENEEQNNKYRQEEMKEKIDSILREYFKLEFLNRIDEIVIFKNLSSESLEKIVDLELNKVEQRLKNKNISIKINNKVKKFLATKSYDPTFGARPLKRVIQNMILDELALNIVEGKVKDGDKILLDIGAKDNILISVK
jgi:ATP-dependent Clp protease ATP-binding subunit ClpA